MTKQSKPEPPKRKIPTDARQLVGDLIDAYQQLLYLWQTRRSCPCGARPESPNTHPHVTGCPTGKAVEIFEERTPDDRTH